MTSRACQGDTESGRPCNTTPLDDSDYCPWHSGEDAKRQFASNLGKLGAAKQAEKKIKLAESAGKPNSFDSIESIREYLERETALGSASGDHKRTQAAAAAARSARELLLTAKLQAEFKELQRLLLEIKPELKSHPLLRGE